VPKGRITILYIAGWGRSGSTMLGGLLAESLAESAYIGELWNIWEDYFKRNDYCGCKRRYRDCPFWRTIFSRSGIDNDTGLELMATKFRFLGTRSLVRPMHLATSKEQPIELRQYLYYLESVYAALAATTNSRVLIEASKTPNLIPLLASSQSIDLKVIHLVRDPRAVAYSWYHRTKQRGPDSSSGEMDRHSPIRSTAGWLARNFFTNKMVNQTKTPSICVRYEQLAETPRNCIQIACRELGLQTSNSRLRKRQSAHGHSVRGNPSRFSSSNANKIVRDDTWKTALPIGERLLITAIAFPMLRTYGYKIQPSQAVE